MNQQFSKERAHNENPKWEQMIKRNEEIYSRSGNIRDDFERDYTRILHSNGYRRLKNKTQVFFATKNDHICTRIEHVNHVASVSQSVSKALGLNSGLVSAIALGHDIGHAPFGHHGEKVLEKIVSEHLDEKFWHEKNSLFFVDKIETLKDPQGKEKTLNLTYAVRDGIVCHCGEVSKDEPIFPRNEYIDLQSLSEANQVQPYTWEGCVVKIADKIAYLGRDIEDAFFFKIFDLKALRELNKILVDCLGKRSDIRQINNTVLINDLVWDLCKTSSPKDGIFFSEKYLRLIYQIKEFNYKYIYKYWRLETFKDYATLVIMTIFKTLFRFYSEGIQHEDYRKFVKREYPNLYKSFKEWLIKYTDIDLTLKRRYKYANPQVYSINDKESYIKCVVDYISGMTDVFAIKVFEEIVSF